MDLYCRGGVSPPTGRETRPLQVFDKLEICETGLGPLLEGAGMTQVMTGGVSYLNYDTPSVFAFGESTSLIEGGKGAVQTC